MILLVSGTTSAGADSAQRIQKFIALGSGSTAGTYYPVAGGICSRINHFRLERLIRCMNYSTGGSDYNIQAVLSGEMDLGITRSDLLQQAYEGSGPYREAGPQPDLRVISPLYPMPLAIIARKEAGITGFEDLPGQRINLGNKGSGKRLIALAIIRALDWGLNDFPDYTEFNTRRMGEAFCAGEIDVFIEALGNPNPFYARMISECGGRFLPIPDAFIKRILAGSPGLSAEKIPGGVYSGQDGDVQTVGFRATLIASSGLSADTVDIVVRTLFKEDAAFNKLHPVLSTFKRSSILPSGIGVPSHQGVVRAMRDIADTVVVDQK